MPNDATSKRGFASMDAERQREIASKGGRSVPAEKRSFSQDRELASGAGRKGGQASEALATGRTDRPLDHSVRGCRKTGPIFCRPSDRTQALPFP
jgi:general stress protein YciG